MSNDTRKLICPSCGEEIQLDDINVEKDVALCRACRKIHPCHELLAIDETEDAALLSQPPPRHLTVERDDSDPWQATRIVYHSVNRSVFFLIPFTLLWSGGIFFALMDFYRKMSASHDGLFPLVFMLPFFLGAFVLCGLCLFLLFGKTVLTLRKGEGKYFCGIGHFGLTRAFTYQRNTHVTLEWGASRQNRRRLLQIVIRTPGEPLFAFPAAVSDPEARAYLVAKLREKCREGF